MGQGFGYVKFLINCLWYGYLFQSEKHSIDPIIDISEHINKFCKVKLHAFSGACNMPKICTCPKICHTMGYC